MPLYTNKKLLVSFVVVGLSTGAIVAQADYIYEDDQVSIQINGDVGGKIYPPVQKQVQPEVEHEQESLVVIEPVPQQPEHKPMKLKEFPSWKFQGWVQPTTKTVEYKVTHSDVIHIQQQPVVVVYPPTKQQKVEVIYYYY